MSFARKHLVLVALIAGAVFVAAKRHDRLNAWCQSKCGYVREESSEDPTRSGSETAVTG